MGDRIQMEGIKKQVSIRSVFIRYIFIFCAVTICLFILFIALFQIGLKSEGILPADYYEKQIEMKRHSIENTERLDQVLGDQYKYVVYDFTGNVLQSNIDKKGSDKIWKDIQKGVRSSKGHYYKVISRKDGICVVLYTLKASYSNVFLQKYLPNPEFSFIIIFIILFIIEVLILSHYFGKLLSNEMLILKMATEKIQKEDLNFEVEQSKIAEVNEVLDSLVKMKEELHHSLIKQWEMETNRKEQISALAHDIQTPLTIVRGNAELLSESDLDLKQAKYNGHILKSIDDMDRYIKTLKDIAKSEEGTSLKFTQVKMKDFMDNIIEKGSIYAFDKQLNIVKDIKEIPEFIYADEDALRRSIMNVMINAIEYSPANSDILFTADTFNSKVRFTIEDSGRGFTKEEMSSAKKQFYRGDKSRNSKNHYGIGLYIAESFVKQHSGSIYLSNSKRLPGAKVVIEIPIYDGMVV